LIFLFLIFLYKINKLDRRFLISNAQLTNKPIIYCNDAFCDLIGYSRADIIQKTCTCEFLYGTETNEKAAKQIRHALQGSDEKEVDIILYKNNGKFLFLYYSIIIKQMCEKKDEKKK
jgi:PAS domain S-box-containing protein